MSKASTEQPSSIRHSDLESPPAAAERLADLGFYLEIWFSFFQKTLTACHELAASKFTVIGLVGQGLSMLTL